MITSIISTINKILPATPIREGFRGYSRVLSWEQHNQKIFFLKSIKIYNEGLVKDPVHDYETLKLLYELDQSLINKNKFLALECLKKFMLNKDETKYGDDFGKAKEHLGSVLHSHRKDMKITPLDVLEHIGISKEQLLAQGLLETTLNKTKNCVSSSVFEILVMNALPKKYEFIEKVHYCQDGYKSLNFTNQSNPDFAIDIKDSQGNFIRISFDSKDGHVYKKH